MKKYTVCMSFAQYAACILMFIVVNVCLAILATTMWARVFDIALAVTLSLSLVIEFHSCFRRKSDWYSETGRAYLCAVERAQQTQNLDEAFAILCCWKELYNIPTKEFVSRLESIPRFKDVLPDFVRSKKSAQKQFLDTVQKIYANTDTDKA